MLASFLPGWIQTMYAKTRDSFRGKNQNTKYTVTETYNRTVRVETKF